MQLQNISPNLCFHSLESFGPTTGADVIVGAPATLDGICTSCCNNNSLGVSFVSYPIAIRLKLQTLSLVTSKNDRDEIAIENVGGDTAALITFTETSLSPSFPHSLAETHCRVTD